MEEPVGVDLICSSQRTGTECETNGRLTEIDIFQLRCQLIFVLLIRIAIVFEVQSFAILSLLFESTQHLDHALLVVEPDLRVGGNLVHHG